MRGRLRTRWNGDCSSQPDFFTNNMQCSGCCDTTSCQREVLSCDRPCSAQQCDEVYAACDYSGGLNQFAVWSYNRWDDGPVRCVVKGGAPPKYRSKDAISCCSIPRSCTNNQCWADKFSCQDGSCPQYCSARCQPCNNGCGGNECSSECSPCPHCCAWAGCPSCSDPCDGMCFMDGNCFGECTCGSPGCPSSNFWALLFKNTTQGSSGDRALLRALDTMIAATPVRWSAVQKEVSRAAVAFSSEETSLTKRRSRQNCWCIFRYKCNASSVT